nr:M1 family peptidase [Nitrosarchaeum sp.]
MKVIPVNYTLEFEPIFKNFTFNGKEIITIQCNELVNSISLHCAELKIKSCNVRQNNISQKTISKIDEKKEELTILFKNKIKGTAFLEIEFTSSLHCMVI